jgi:hypothetical protein
MCWVVGVGGSYGLRKGASRMRLWRTPVRGWIGARAWTWATAGINSGNTKAIAWARAWAGAGAGARAWAWAGE